MPLIFNSNGYSWIGENGQPILEQSKIALCPAQGNLYLIYSGAGEVIPEGRIWPGTAEFMWLTPAGRSPGMVAMALPGCQTSGSLPG